MMRPTIAVVLCLVLCLQISDALECINGPPPPPPCTNLCRQIQTCSAGQNTSISGYAFAGTPINPDPLYNAIVFIPNAPLDSFTSGVQCSQCGGNVSGSPLVTFTTGADGYFNLVGVPAGNNIPIVVQLGRWRRLVYLPTVVACRNNVVVNGTVRLPRTSSEGDIPRIAVSTGNADAMECILRQMGVSDSEFTVPSGAGRIHMYKFNGAGMADARGNDISVPASTLYNNLTLMMQYDLIIFDCEGGANNKPDSAQANVVAYANAGGRLFMSHYSYTWIYQNPVWQNTATWVDLWNNGVNNELIGIVNTSFPKGQAFGQWLSNVGSTISRGSNTFYISVPRYAAIPPYQYNTQAWVTSSTSVKVSGGNSFDSTQHLTFNTPVGVSASQQCGRVMYSSFHVTGAQSSGNANFPLQCDGGNTPTALTAEQRVLEFMLYDLSSCVTPDVPVYYPPCVTTGIQTTAVKSTGVQSTGIQSTGVQTTGVQTTGVQTTGVQTTGVQTTGVQTTGVQTTGVQTTGVQTTGVQTTGVQTTDVQTTGVQTTGVQTTGVQTTDIQTTDVQTTDVQTTDFQTTGVQTTGIQTTDVQTTDIQTTAVQTTDVQTTDVQTTAIQTTRVQTTGVQTTGVQSTGVQTTDVQTTQVQTTEVQTTIFYDPDATTSSITETNFTNDPPSQTDADVVNGKAASEKTNGLGLGAIIGIALAVVAVIASIAVIGGRKVHNKFLERRKNALHSVSANPLFSGTGSEFFSALYDPHEGAAEFDVFNDSANATQMDEIASGESDRAAHSVGGNRNTMRRQQSIIKTPSSLDD